MYKMDILQITRENPGRAGNPPLPLLRFSGCWLGSSGLEIVSPTRKVAPHYWPPHPMLFPFLSFSPPSCIGPAS